jgi:hypothetical protein
MPRGDKSSYSDKQKRMAEHIEEGYKKRGTSKGEAEHRAWATVNKETHGGKKSGSAEESPKTTLRLAGGQASAHRSATLRLCEEGCADPQAKRRLGARGDEK